MNENDRFRPIQNSSDTFGILTNPRPNSGNVPKEDRKRVVVEFLVQYPLALSRTVLYRNLRYKGATFGSTSLQNYLNELRDEGRVARIDAEEFAEGRLVKSDGEPAYWIATRDGAEWVVDSGIDNVDISEIDLID